MKYLFSIACLFLVIGCSASNDEEVKEQDSTNASETAVESMIRFGEMDVKIENKVIYLTGNADTEEDSFYYTFEQGDTIVLDEMEVLFDGEEDGWKNFEIEINIPEDVRDSEETSFIKLYKKENGEVIDPNYVPVDIINY